MRDPNACERSHRKTFAFDSRFQFQFHSIDDCVRLKSCWTAPKHTPCTMRWKKMKKNWPESWYLHYGIYIYLHWMHAIIRHRMINAVPDSHDVITGQSIRLLTYKQYQLHRHFLGFHCVINARGYIVVCARRWYWRDEKILKRRKKIDHLVSLYVQKVFFLFFFIYP